MKRPTLEMQNWVNEWPIGSKGIFGGRFKHHITVVDIEWDKGFPTLRITEDGTGLTYYCKYGWRHNLRHEYEM